MERDTTITGNSKQVFIVPSTGTDPDGCQFELFIDLPNKRTYTMRKFFSHYANDFFGEWVMMHLTLVIFEPNQATLVFHDTNKGRELATMFRLGHDDYPFPVQGMDVIW